MLAVNSYSVSSTKSPSKVSQKDVKSSLKVGDSPQSVTTGRKCFGHMLSKCIHAEDERRNAKISLIASVSGGIVASIVTLGFGSIIAVPHMLIKGAQYYNLKNKAGEARKELETYARENFETMDGYEASSIYNLATLIRNGLQKLDPAKKSECARQLEQNLKQIFTDVDAGTKSLADAEKELRDLKIKIKVIESIKKSGKHLSVDEAHQLYQQNRRPQSPILSEGPEPVNTQIVPRNKRVIPLDKCINKLEGKQSYSGYLNLLNFLSNIEDHRFTMKTDSLKGWKETCDTYLANLRDNRNSSLSKSIYSHLTELKEELDFILEYRREIDEIENLRGPRTLEFDDTSEVVYEPVADRRTWDDKNIYEPIENFARRDDY